jgi:hypothetical protein
MNHPGDEHGCRCYKEILPIHTKIIEEENMEEENKMLKNYHENRQVYIMKPALKIEYPSEI